MFHSVYIVLSIGLISFADLFAVRYLWDVCNKDNCCVVTHRVANILSVSLGLLTRLTRSHVLRAYCNFESRLLRGALGYIRNRKTEEKIIQNRKTAKKFGQNRKPHTKPSKTDTMVTSGAYRAS